MKDKVLDNLIWIIFFIVGMTFSLVALFFGYSMFNIENKTQGVAIITKMDNDEVYVTYEVDGKEYNNKLNMRSSSFYVGKEIKIYYNQENPNIVVCDDLKILIYIFLGIGLVFLLISVVIMFFKIKSSKLKKYLKEHGKLIFADYVDVVLNTSYNVNGRHPYKVICKWENPIDNKIYMFTSKNIWVNISVIISDKKLLNLLNNENWKSKLTFCNVLKVGF